MSSAVDQQSPPVKNDHPFIVDLVLQDLPTLLPASRWAEQLSYQDLCADLETRKAFGIAKYGTALQPFNGRDPLVDVYQELLDGLQYMRQAIFEFENGKEPSPARAAYLRSHYQQLALSAISVRALLRVGARDGR